MTETRIIGLAASSGLARGRWAALARQARLHEASDDPAQEAAALKAAIDRAGEQLAALIADGDAMGGEVLGFQLAILEDSELTDPAFAAIKAGAPADQAWRDALAAEIANYATAEDPYFQARAADFEDLRDRVLDCLSGADGSHGLEPGAIIVAEDVTPSRFLSIDWSQGGALVLGAGSPSSHVAMLARARGVPMVVNAPIAEAAPGLMMLVDGGSGEILLDPSPLSERAFERRLADQKQAAARAAGFLFKPAVTADGVAISVQVNLGDPSELEGLDPALCDGVGLVRSEFLFHDRPSQPDEETQYQAYRRIVEWAAGRPVTIRTLDAGGDKPVPGLTIDGESNPFLGVRGLRLSLRRPETFHIQLRALLRAAIHGDVRVMLPMVTLPRELTAAREAMAAAVASLEADKLPFRRVPLGIMVEVPAAALAIDLFDADFYSIGSNDLAQYVAAAGRDIGAVADLQEPVGPAMLRLIADVAAHGRKTGAEVCLCGDAGGDPAMVEPLLRAGLRSLSMAPSRVGPAKAAIAATALKA